MRFEGAGDTVASQHLSVHDQAQQAGCTLSLDVSGSSQALLLNR